MGVDIGTQIIIVLVFGFMALLTKKNYPKIAKIFGIGSATLLVLFSILDIIDSLGLVT